MTGPDEQPSVRTRRVLDATEHTQADRPWTPPTNRDLAYHTGLTHSTVRYHLHRLATAGYRWKLRRPCPYGGCDCCRGTGTAPNRPNGQRR